MARRTKIVCTLGPAVDDEALVRELLIAGMDVARFNFSHGSHDEHRARMDRLKRVRADARARRAGRPLRHHAG
ncbi:pyruvate kinase, partial [Eggerthella sinensis]|uniref:pyruvate kinase n=1 Tax=Eggerthella sinensis TaxID=242230 RepID=UPI0022E4F16F